MIFYSKTINRNILLTFTLISIVLGWSVPIISCACANSTTISISYNHQNHESPCCSKCKELRRCSCCTIDDDQLISISNIMSATGCQCVLHSNGLPGSKMIISEIADSCIIKPQLINGANIFSLITNLNQALSRKNDPCSFKIKDTTSLLVIYCQLNI